MRLGPSANTAAAIRRQLVDIERQQKRAFGRGGWSP
jgi:hypothetical protein